MIVKKFPFNPFPVNTYVIHDEATKECAIIDPGCYWAEEKEELKDYIEKNNLKVKHLLLTHLHLDHALAVPFVANTFNVPFSANKKDEFLLENGVKQAAQYGLRLEDAPIPVAQPLQEGDKIKLGDTELNVMEVPGHSPGSVVFYNEKEHKIFVGDVLFLGSIGRTDLPGGNYEQLISGIRSKLLTLPDNTVVYSGHGPETNIGYERINNPFLR